MIDTSHRKIEVIARGLCAWRGRALLCRDLARGHCYLPGGHVEPGESSKHACEREYLEETGLNVRCGVCLLVAEVRFVQEGVARHEITIVFHVEQSTGEPLSEQVSSLEPKLAFEWISADQIENANFRPHAILGPVRSLLSQSEQERSARAEWISALE